MLGGVCKKHKNSRRLVKIFIYFISHKHTHTPIVAIYIYIYMHVCMLIYLGKFQLLQILVPYPVHSIVDSRLFVVWDTNFWTDLTAIHSNSINLWGKYELAPWSLGCFSIRPPMFKNSQCALPKFQFLSM